jgi:hypothetical protein
MSISLRPALVAIRLFFVCLDILFNVQLFASVAVTSNGYQNGVLFYPVFISMILKDVTLCYTIKLGRLWVRLSFLGVFRLPLVLAPFHITRRILVAVTQCYTFK